MIKPLNDEVNDEEDEYYDDYFDDTAECSACGRYYCTCCGCDCWLGDYEDDEMEDD